MRCKSILGFFFVSWLSAAAMVLADDALAEPKSTEKLSDTRGARERTGREGRRNTTEAVEQAKYWKESLVPIEDVPGLPRVLIVGDSVSVCYTLATREQLKGEANVHRIPANGGHTRQALDKIDGWVGGGHWDVIHFNWGLHDLRYGVNTSIEEYEQNLRQLVESVPFLSTVPFCPHTN